MTSSAAPVAREELETITDDLGRQLRPDGTSRNIVDAAERARVNASRAIRASIEKIDAQDPPSATTSTTTSGRGRTAPTLPDPTATPDWRL